MTLTVVDQAEENFLDLVLAVGYTLHLYQNDVTDGLTTAQKDSLTEADFTEATFAGYAASTLTGGSWTTTAGNPATGSYAAQSFTSTADQTAQTLYGYYVTRTSDGALQWFEDFTIPLVIEFDGEFIRVTPRITLADEVD